MGGRLYIEAVARKRQAREERLPTDAHPSQPRTPRRGRERSLRHILLNTSVMPVTIKIQVRGVVEKHWTKSQEAQALDPAITPALQFSMNLSQLLYFSVPCFLYLLKKNRLGKLPLRAKILGLYIIYTFLIKINDTWVKGKLIFKKATTFVLLWSSKSDNRIGL